MKTADSIFSQSDYKVPVTVFAGTMEKKCCSEIANGFPDHPKSLS